MAAELTVSLQTVMRTPEVATEPEDVHSKIREALVDVALTCTRDWSAWGYGTMTEADFMAAEEDEDLVNSLSAHPLELLEENLMLRAAQHIGVELTNHHNAAMCLYCSRLERDIQDAAAERDAKAIKYILELENRLSIQSEVLYQVHATVTGEKYFSRSETIKSLERGMAASQGRLVGPTAAVVNQTPKESLHVPYTRSGPVVWSDLDILAS